MTEPSGGADLAAPRPRHTVRVGLDRGRLEDLHHQRDRCRPRRRGGQYRPRRARCAAPHYSPSRLACRDSTSPANSTRSVSPKQTLPSCSSTRFACRPGMDGRAGDLYLGRIERDHEGAHRARPRPVISRTRHAMWIDFSSTKARRPAGPSSRPKPEAFRPPNGASAAPQAPFTLKLPTRTRRATCMPYSTSEVHTDPYAGEAGRRRRPTYGHQLLDSARIIYGS